MQMIGAPHVTGIPAAEPRDKSVEDRSTLPLVSIITPTRNRSTLHDWTLHFVMSQDYGNIEWLIEDDSDMPSLLLSSLTHPRVKYRYEDVVCSTGEKRNRLIQRASGDIIVHFDDDDYYSPSYVSRLVAPLVDGHADVAKLTGFFVFDQRRRAFFYWDQTVIPNDQFVCKAGVEFAIRQPTMEQRRNAINHFLGFGFSYAYRRSVWERHSFKEISFAEDLIFMREAMRSATVFFSTDRVGVCLHLIHDASSSGCFPQFVLPTFISKTYFPLLDSFLEAFG